MLHDGQPIEFPVEMIGAEQDLGSGPIILEAHGRGVETATHKYIVFDSGDAALYDLAVDPDGMNNIAADPAWAGLIQELSAKLAAFPAPPAAAPVAAPITPDVPKVAVPAPVATPELPEPASPPTAIPALATPAEVAVPAAPVPAALESKPSLPALPKPSQVKLPDIGLPPGVGDEPEEASPVTALPVPPAPSSAKPASIELPQPGLPKPGAVPTLDSPAKPKLPPPPKPAAEEAEPEAPKPAPTPLPKPSATGEVKPATPPVKNEGEAPTDSEDDDTAASKEKAELKKALIEEFDTDGDGKISSEETPSAEQLKKFTTRRREKPKVDRLDNKRKSRMEAKSAVKSAMRELEEARLREEMTVRGNWKRIRQRLIRFVGAVSIVMKRSPSSNKPINRVGKKPRLLLPNFVEFEHDEELIRHGVGKKAAQMDDEDRISDWTKNFTVAREETEHSPERRKTVGERRKANKLMSVICSE